MTAIVPAWSRLRVQVRSVLSKSPRAWGLLVAGSAALGILWMVRGSARELPADVKGTLVFVSGRTGLDTLYLRTLPHGAARRLTRLDEAAADPALSPAGDRVAFGVGGRIGIVDVKGGPVRFLTLGHPWHDEAPAWRPGGGALAVAARRSPTALRDIHLLTLSPGGEPMRQLLTETPHLDEAQPVFAPAAAVVVFIREDNLYRLDLPPAREARPVRLTGGFRKVRSPRFLPSGRVLFLWTHGKEYGIDTIDIHGKNRETLHTGTTFYRSVVPSPDGRYLAVTFTFDLAFRPWSALGSGHREELRLLDARGTPLAPLEDSWRHANHTADWGP